MKLINSEIDFEGCKRRAYELARKEFSKQGFIIGKICASDLRIVKTSQTKEKISNVNFISGRHANRRWSGDWGGYSDQFSGTHDFNFSIKYDNFNLLALAYGARGDNGPDRNIFFLQLVEARPKGLGERPRMLASILRVIEIYCREVKYPEIHIPIPMRMKPLSDELISYLKRMGFHEHKESGNLYMALKLT